MTDFINYNLKDDPISSFQDWYLKAKELEDNPEAMTLATYNSTKHRPETRTVLFKGLKEGKLTFYTNYLSNKSKDLDSSNEASLLFYWHKSGKQVKVQGRVEKMDRESSRQYFHSRDRQSQLASYMSHQSAEVKDKAALIEKLNQVTKEFDGKEIPLPDHWGGYIFTPYEFEFFLYGEFRLNDRFLYQLNNGKWSVSRLQP